MFLLLRRNKEWLQRNIEWNEKHKDTIIAAADSDLDDEEVD